VVETGAVVGFRAAVPGPVPVVSPLLGDPATVDATDVRRDTGSATLDAVLLCSPAPAGGARAAVVDEVDDDTGSVTLDVVLLCSPTPEGGARAAVVDVVDDDIRFTVGGVGRVDAGGGRVDVLAVGRAEGLVEAAVVDPETALVLAVVPVPAAAGRRAVVVVVVVVWVGRLAPAANPVLDRDKVLVVLAGGAAGGAGSAEGVSGSDMVN
jgi:hypothetical protein